MKKFKVSIALLDNSFRYSPRRGGFFGVEIEAENEKEAKRIAIDSLLYNEQLEQREVSGNAVAEEII